MQGRWAQFRNLFFLSDEDMGKKNDDHQPAAGPTALLRNPHWQPTARVPPRRVLRRWTTLILVAVAIWFLLSYLTLDLGFGAGHHSPYHGQKDIGGMAPDRDYNGPLRFRQLAESLNAIPTQRGTSHSRNVLFFAASLQSASTLLPLACAMGMERKNDVHFALTSRETILLEDLQRVNGIDSSCQILFHDARPNYADVSADTRMQRATMRALFHINSFMRPQVVIVDGTDREERWFRDGTRLQSESINLPQIELPRDAAERLTWLAKLDSYSLAAWDKITIDILVHAPPTGSGSLLRLLKSLNAADFPPSTIPHLTIELPFEVEPETHAFLQKFRWPPARLIERRRGVQMLSLRHRIARHRMTDEESAARFFESFWPQSPKYSHILVLSPQAELTPQFFHYLKFALLEYRYSQNALLEEWDERLLGISMALPRTYINGSERFIVPEASDPDHSKRLGTSFLWQAPQSDAILVMGDKWIEMHGLVSRTLEKQRGPTFPALLSDKFVGKQYPSWLEHALRLSRARGYFTFYPSPDTASAVATVHQDLFRAPTEYEMDLEQERGDQLAGPLVNVLDTLPNRGDLASLSRIPLLDWDGTVGNLWDMDHSARQYAAKWRREVGGCSEEETERAWPHRTAKDLFCGEHYEGGVL